MYGISLILELASPSLVEEMLNPPQVLWYYIFLLGGSIVFANEGKRSCIMDIIPHNHSTIDEIYY